MASPPLLAEGLCARRRPPRTDRSRGFRARPGGHFGPRVRLGWTGDPETGRHFYVRQLKNRRLGSIGELMESGALGAYASLCGRTLGRAHARTGDPAALAGYMGKSEPLDDALATFAMAYAAQTRRDHAQLKAACQEKEFHLFRALPPLRPVQSALPCLAPTATWSSAPTRPSHRFTRAAWHISPLLPRPTISGWLRPSR
jgi:Uncharacterized protein conserved in bacteria (DUF2252)